MFSFHLLHEYEREFICHSQGLSDGGEMYAFYSLLVYIFYTVFKKEEEEEQALEAAHGGSSDVRLQNHDQTERGGWERWLAAGKMLDFSRAHVSSPAAVAAQVKNYTCEGFPAKKKKKEKKKMCCLFTD